MYLIEYFKIYCYGKAQSFNTSPAIRCDTRLGSDSKGTNSERFADNNKWKQQLKKRPNSQNHYIFPGNLNEERE